MDPITISMLASAVAALAVEVGKGMAGEAGKDLWNKIKQTLGLKSNISSEEVDLAVKAKLVENPTLGSKVYDMLQTSQNSNVKQLVGKIDAEKVVVANQLNVSGDFNM